MAASIAAGCSSEPDTQPVAPVTRPVQYVESNDGIVATADPMATAAGIRILELGGNAVDAAVAAGFALSVVEPSMSGIGGRAVLLLRLPDGSFHGIDGMSQVPAAYVPEEGVEAEYGYRTIGVPGAVAAYGQALEAFGSLPLATVIRPAIELAENGLELPFSTTDEKLLESAGARQSYRRPDGTPYLAGEHFRQPALARTLRLIAEGGADAFYRGEIAAAIARDMQQHGGFLTASDLAGYEARPLRVVKGSYRGFELIGTGSPPSGYMLIEALHILEHFDLPASDEAKWGVLLCQALQVAKTDRDTLPGPAEDRENRMVSKEWAADRARSLGAGETQEKISNGSVPAAPDGSEPVHTSHLSVVDRNGMAVALTQSLGPEYGSRVATPDLGFLYAVTMGAYKDGAPGTRPNLSQSPFMVLKDDRPLLVLGAAGGGRIPSAILSVISRFLDRGDAFREAMSGPRVHTGETCPRLETTGTFRFDGTVEGVNLTGEFRSEWDDVYPVTGIRNDTGAGFLGDWQLSIRGQTTHPYSDVGVLSLMRLGESDTGLTATLLNGTNNMSGQPAIEPRAAESVSLVSNRLSATFAPRIQWSAGDRNEVRRFGAEPLQDKAVARVHALYFDVARDVWIGMADPRGRGSAASAQHGDVQ
jgi:gamma-glutamyltranspeptidase/glutathione hydrolase